RVRARYPEAASDSRRPGVVPAAPIPPRVGRAAFTDWVRRSPPSRTPGFSKDLTMLPTWLLHMTSLPRKDLRRGSWLRNQLRRFRPHLEVLEDRLTPAPLTVLNTQDTGDCQERKGCLMLFTKLRQMWLGKVRKAQKRPRCRPQAEILEDR